MLADNNDIHANIAAHFRDCAYQCPLSLASTAVGIPIPKPVRVGSIGVMLFHFPPAAAV